jgi:hypothetical protein
MGVSREAAALASRVDLAVESRFGNPVIRLGHERRLRPRCSRACAAVDAERQHDHECHQRDRILGFSCRFVLFQICKTGHELKSERLLINCQVINLVEGNISVAFEIESATRWAKHLILRQDRLLLSGKGLYELGPLRLGRWIITGIDINESPAFPSNPVVVDAWIRSLTDGGEP